MTKLSQDSWSPYREFRPELRRVKLEQSPVNSTVQTHYVITVARPQCSSHEFVPSGHLLVEDKLTDGRR
jgi:hypothetical protein